MASRRSRVRVPQAPQRQRGVPSLSGEPFIPRRDGQRTLEKAHSGWCLYNESTLRCGAMPVFTGRRGKG